MSVNGGIKGCEDGEGAGKVERATMTTNDL